MARWQTHKSFSLITLTLAIPFFVFVSCKNTGNNPANQSVNPSATPVVASPSTAPVAVTPAPVTVTPVPATAAPLPTSSQAINDYDYDGIDDTVEDQLIQRFAPVIRFHSEEQYLPTNISWFLDRVRMRFDVRRGLDDQILDKGSATSISLNSQKNRNQISGLSTNPSDFFLEQTDATGGDDLDSYRKATRKGAGMAAAVNYAHVRPAPVATNLDMYDIQYVFFYAYNGDMLETMLESAHEADMEHITVRVKKDLVSVYQIYFAAHDNEGKWYNSQTSGGTQGWRSVTGDNRPIVYAAINSHASYPGAGKQSRGTALPDDETNDRGIEWDTRKNVINLGEKNYPRKGMEWIQYSGRWGELGDTSFTSGPFGPAYQGWWDSDPE